LDEHIPLTKTGEGSAGTVNETMMLKTWNDAEAGPLHPVGGAHTTRMTREAAELSDASEKAADVRDDGDDLKMP
jgi:hypothetical protein